MSLSTHPTETATAFLVRVPQGLTDEALIGELVRRGWRRPVRDDGAGWIPFGELARRTGRPVDSLCRTIASAGKHHVPGLEVECGPSGRIVRCRATEEFYDWLQATSPRRKTTTS